ncbi:MAG TPA: hypothetical protein VFI06_13255 [Chitinophagaceae bacterium]|nr:hypothetical protein [Chitinophagaceae bacterium]
MPRNSPNIELVRVSLAILPCIRGNSSMYRWQYSETVKALTHYLHNRPQAMTTGCNAIVAFINFRKQSKTSLLKPSMKNNSSISRRVAVKSSVFGLLAISVSNVLFAKKVFPTDGGDGSCRRYPAIEDSVAAEMVGVSHFDLDRVKKLVTARPELSRATWDWGFGDWETAIGAASHVGRKDIVDFLMLNGARPDIFTFAMLGSYQIVKTMIEFTPGVQRILGPHGISLVQHVKNGITGDNNNKDESGKLLAFLESLGDADGEKYMGMEEQDKQKYLGDYKYGDGDADGFSVKLNSRKLISLGRLGKNGGALYKISDNKFIYNGAPSVLVSFLIENDKVLSLTVTEPGLTLTARKI